MAASKISIIRKGILSLKGNSETKLVFLKVEGRSTASFANGPEFLDGTLIQISLKDEEFYLKMKTTMRNTTIISLYRKSNSNELWKLVNTETRDYLL